jgi:hypothetical protein
MYSKFANSVNMTKKRCFSYCGVSKNVEFYADFKFVEKGSKIFRNRVIVKKIVGFSYLALVPFVFSYNFFRNTSFVDQ